MLIPRYPTPDSDTYSCPTGDCLRGFSQVAEITGVTGVCSSGANRDRTGDLLLAKHLPRDVVDDAFAPARCRWKVRPGSQPPIGAAASAKLAPPSCRTPPGQR